MAIIDLESLDIALSTENWELANVETCRAIVRIAGGSSSNKSPVLSDFITAWKLEKVSCEALLAIDKLWVMYSEGKFGFSVQARLLGHDAMAVHLMEKRYEPTPFLKVADSMGWYLDTKVRATSQTNVDGDWGFIETSYIMEAMAQKSHISFNLQAPKGHLPILFPLGVDKKYKYSGQIRYTNALTSPKEVEEFLYRFSQCLAG